MSELRAKKEVWSRLNLCILLADMNGDGLINIEEYANLSLISMGISSRED